MTTDHNEEIDFSKAVRKNKLRVARWLATISGVSRQLAKRVDKRLVIVRYDGGICSQILFHSLQRYLEFRGCRVKADLDWYDRNGMDMDGRFVRNFDLLRAFPEIRVERASGGECWQYRLFYDNKDETFIDREPPRYFGRYYELWPLVVDYLGFYREHFRPAGFADDSENFRLFDEIVSLGGNSCAMHVRRGDLAKDRGVWAVYGQPPSVEYFAAAVKTVAARVGKRVKVFLFSDEPEWVKAELLPKLPGTAEYHVADGNDSGKGFCDLYLISKCCHFILSNGSLGSMGMLLASRDDGTVVLPESRRARLATWPEAIRQRAVVL